MTLLYMFLDAVPDIGEYSNTTKMFGMATVVSVITVSVDKIIAYWRSRDKIKEAKESKEKDKAYVDNKFQALVERLDDHIAIDAQEKQQRHNAELERIQIQTQMASDISYLVKAVDLLNKN